MYALGFLCLVASAVALPAKSDARPPVIEYTMPVPFGYYAPPGPILRGNMAFADSVLAPLNDPLVQEVVIEDEPKKDSSSEKLATEKPEIVESEKPIIPESEKLETPESEKPEKPEEGKPITTVKLEVAKPPIVHRFSWPSWLPSLSQLNLPFKLPFKLPELPLVSNAVSYLQPQRLGAVPVYGYPAVI